MIHAFLLVIILNGKELSSDAMYFYNVYKCNDYAAAIVGGKREARGVRHDATILAAYCIPKRVNPENTVIY